MPETPAKPSKEDIFRFANEEDDHPALTELRQRIETLDGDAFPDLEALFERLAIDYVPDRLNRLLRKYQDEPADFEVPFGSLQTLVLNASFEHAVGVSIVDHNPRYLYWHPRHSWYRLLGENKVRVHRYRVPEGTGYELIDSAVALERGEPLDLNPGDTLVRDGRRDIVDFEVEPGRPITLLRLQLKELGGIEWMFDRATLRPVGATALNPNDSHLMNLIYGASRLGDSASVEPLRAALEHPQHSVRWSAVQALGRIDRVAALAALGRAVRDPHPHIRAAAQATLSRVHAPAEDGKAQKHGIHA